MKIVHLTTSVSRAAGGLYESVRHLSMGVAALGPQALVEVIGARDAYTNQDAKLWQPLPVRTHYIWGPERFGYAYGMTRDLMSSEPDLVHMHGVWQYTSVALIRWARRAKKPYIVSPHGMMEPWSLKRARLKKGVASLLYHRHCLNNAACIRATSKLEAQSVRQAGFKNPIAVIPNGVIVPVMVPRSKRDASGKKVKRALFLSRIHPKKGLLNLVKAWHLMKPSDWELRIVGPDEGGHLAEVKAEVRSLGLEGQINFMDEVMGDEKHKCYCDADLFVLPSFSENFGLVIAEALSCGVPVITTRATPWEELETHRCGWWIETGVEPLVTALRMATSLSEDELVEMGKRGRQLIENRYSWPTISHDMLEVYKWMLGSRPRPECIID